MLHGEGHGEDLGAIEEREKYGQNVLYKKNLIIKKTIEAVNTVHPQTTSTSLHLLPAVQPHSAFYSVDSINC